MNLAIAAALWILGVLFGVRARSRRKNTLYWAILLLAGAMTLNVDSIYIWFDALMPIANLGDLLANISMIVGLFLLLRAIRQGIRSTAKLWRDRWDIWALVVTLTTMIISFTALESPETSTTFMLDYGDQPATAVYSSIQHIFLASVMIFTATTTVKNIPHLRSSRYRIGAQIVSLGCIFGVALCISVLMMNGLHVLGELTLMRAIGPIHDVLRLLTVIMLATGMAVPAVLRQLLNRRRKKHIKAAAEDIYRIWTETGPDQVDQTTDTYGQDHPARGTTQEIANRVHRMIIEIHDWANLSAVEEPLDQRQWRKIDEAERLCLHASER